MPDLSPQLLLDRLEAIGRSLARRPQALALIGLGSVGLETGRLDRWSDLDFFVIVDEGCQAAFIDDLGWLAEAAPLTWHFRNTVDGHKAWMHDGVFCEFAVFTPSALRGIPYAPGRLVWSRDPGAVAWTQPSRPVPARGGDDRTWLIGELLSNLHVGLLRWCRGERLAGSRLVQVHALDRFISLLGPGGLEGPAAGVDPFNPERRIEARRPEVDALLGRLMPGRDRTPEAVLAMLDALEARGVDLPPEVSAAIRAAAQAALSS